MSNATLNPQAVNSGHPITDKAKESLHSSVDTLAEKTARAEASLRDKASNSAENIAQRKEELDEKWNSSSVRKYAVDNPVTTAGIAFAAGILLTSLLRKN